MSFIWEILKDAMKAGYFKDVKEAGEIKKNGETIGKRYEVDNGSFSLIWRKSNSTGYTMEVTAKGVRVNHITDNPKIKRKK